MTVQHTPIARQQLLVKGHRLCFLCVMEKPLNIAVTAWHLDEHGHAAELADQARFAESLGFHSFWLPENHLGDPRAIPAPLMLLAAVAATTDRIRLGSTSYLLPIRHPLQAAEEVAVLDRLSGGRVILGVGRGVQPSMFDAFGVNSRDKRKIFVRNLKTMIRAWQGEPLVDGDPASVLAPQPVQRPHPPIWIAAFGPLAIKQAGTLGMPYLASPVETLTKLAGNYERHREVACESGHDPVTIAPVMRTVFVSERASERDVVREALSTGAPHGMREPGAGVDDWAIIGDIVQVRDRVTEYRQRLGMTHLIARGRIPGVDNAAQLRSLEQLASLQS